MFTVGVSICINHQQRPVPWCLRDSSVAPGPCGGAESGAVVLSLVRPCPCFSLFCYGNTTSLVTGQP